MNGWVDGRTEKEGRISRWMGGWMDGWMDAQTDE